MTSLTDTRDKRRTWLSQLPNAISVARLAATPVLYWMATEDMEAPFAWLLVAALASDAVDGLLARRYAWTSRLGSLFDAVADAVLTLTAAYGVWVFHPDVFTGYSFTIWLVLGMWAFEHFLAFLRYGRPSSFHTRLVRLAVFFFGCFLAVLFLIGFQAWLFYLTAITSLAAVLEEIAMIVVMPDWTPDLRGGLTEALRRRREIRRRENA
jgi:phosphatidylglycerophosphate synthase